MLFDFRNIYQANKIPTFTVKKENKTYTFVACQTMSKTFIIKGMCPTYYCSFQYILQDDSKI